MALQGRMILELAREKKIGTRVKREVVNRIDKHNDITPYADNVLNDGNFFNIVNRGKLYPLMNNFFGGCLLTDNVNVASLSMIAGNSNVTAQASNDAYSGTYSKRGSFNTIESGRITGGYRNVFDWSTAQGNGTIASVCLCRPQFARAEISTSDTIPDTGVVKEQLSDEFDIGSSDIKGCQIIDYNNDRAYSISYSSGIITVNVYRVSTTHIYILDAALSADLIETHTISQTVDNWSTATTSISYNGSHIHILTFQNNSGTLKDYAIPVNNLDTVTVTAHSYTGVSFRSFEDWRDYLPQKDGFLIVGDYLWGLSTSNGSKFVKCNLLGNNDADVTAYDNPWGSIEAGRNGPFLLLPNGDWYKFSRYRGTGEIENAVYYHNGVLYRARAHGVGQSASYSTIGINGGSYGTLINTTYSSMGANLHLFTLFPYVSTVNNLSEAVIKSADLTMKLTYEITEVTT